jgi:vancomycin resistance protein YoaR
MDIIFECTVFQVSSDLQFKSEFSEEIQINKKFGDQKKNKNMLCRVSTEDTRQRRFLPSARYLTLGKD